MCKEWYCEVQIHVDHDQYTGVRGCSFRDLRGLLSVRRIMKIAPNMQYRQHFFSDVFLQSK